MSEVFQVVKFCSDMTTKNVSNISNFVFCGVVAGYDNENSVQPEAAARLVSNSLNSLGIDAVVFPAVCVYHTDWGCPVGGEAVGAFQLPEATALEVCDKLRKELHQSTLSVCLPTVGTKTIGFVAEIGGDLRAVGAKWQEIAAKKMQETGIYVSCGITDNAGRLTISAEANPEFVSDTENWKKVVKDICRQLGTSPSFSAVCYNYLK